MKSVLSGLFLVLILVPGISAQDLLERGEPRIYYGKNLEAVGMPIGGIGTGNIWIAGDGSLSVWQIFNNINETGHVPDSFFAVRAKVQGKSPVLCSLEEVEHEGFEPVKVKSFRGDYPFAWLEYQHPELPVEIALEAYNPMVPLNFKDSSIPCAQFRITARNPGKLPVEVSLAAMLQNAVGYDGTGKVEDRRFWGYGGNRNELKSGVGYAAYLLEVPEKKSPILKDPIRLLYSGPMHRTLAACMNLDLVSLPSTGPAAEVDALWIDRIAHDTDRRLVHALARAVRRGGFVVLSAGDGAFFRTLQEIKGGLEAGGPGPDCLVFEDFESGNYANWTVENLDGEGFGTKPHTGTSPGQQLVSGFMGKGLVNSFVPDDQPQGILTSTPFTIDHDYIGFLVGGGAHRDATCIRLKVDGEVIRSSTGKNNEYLEPAQWNVSDLKGKEGILEIVDKVSGAWGHINIDQIVFSDTPPLGFLGKGEDMTILARNMPFVYEGRDTDFEAAGWGMMEIDAPGLDPSLKSVFVAVGSFGKARMVLDLEGTMDPGWGLGWIAEDQGTEYEHGTGLSEDLPAFGSMTLLYKGDGATVCADWKTSKDLAADLLDDGRLSGPETSKVSPTEETCNCALAVPFTLEPGEERSVDFGMTWCFPNLERYGHQGNHYSAIYSSALTVAAYVLRNLEALRETTLLFHDTLYETNLPYWMVDCLSSQSCIFRTVLCFFAERHKDTGKPYFAGYEGSRGCCPLNCTHVWNYAQTHARLYPEIGQNLRWYDFMHYMKDSGETQHRQHTPHGAFIDGQCAVIEGAYREYLMSPDDTFLREIWPNVKKAVDWLILKIDPDEDGVNSGHQLNTYDVATSGAHTFIGSQYLSALAAAERMALAMGDHREARRFAKIHKTGSKNQDRLLWDGEYYIQIPDDKPARDYNTGCHSDQLLGQWWSHMLDTGYRYPMGHVRTALDSINKYNHRNDFQGFTQRPRRYVIDEEGGLLMCTWPKEERPDPFILYADEIWTGIEYATAGLMIYEGKIEEAFDIVHTARSRYDGMLREGLNSGPGGNPFNELECGGFYARALSSWSLLLASQGFVYEGPMSRIGFIPRWKPEDHQSFFCAAEGWGLFSQKKKVETGLWTAAIEIRYGLLRVKEILLGRYDQGKMVFVMPVEVTMSCKQDGAKEPEITKLKPMGTQLMPDRLSILLEDEAVVKAGDTLIIRLKW